MRRFFVAAVFVVALFGLVTPPVFAQAPTPKVTITGLFDQITSTGHNIYDGNFSRTSDREWYARTRFRPDFVFEVGRTKAVLGLEIDLSYGQSSANANGAGKGAASPSGKGGATSDSSLNTDVAGVIEAKWLYTEFDLTGKDSLLPFIPVMTVARAGLQPFGSLGNLKTSYANGDFAGISATTTFAPNLATDLAFVMVEDELAGQNRGATAGSKATRGDDWAVIVAPEITPFKGLTIKPMYSLFYAEGLTNGNARRNATNRFSAGGATNAAGTYSAAGGLYAGGSPTLHENRHTIGVDARWRMGPFGFDPTIYYQFGHVNSLCACPVNGAAFSDAHPVEADISAWLVDMQGSFALGPLLLEARAIYSTGNNARDNLAKSIHYFQPLDEDTSYYAGWASIMALGIDYFNGGGGTLNGMSNLVGYDRYGRAQLGLRATYSVTPALKVYGVVSPTWTAKKVDTDTGQGGGTRTIVNDQSFVKGDSSYIGTEADIGLSWKFAPNTAFDLSGAYLFAGNALKTTEILNGVATKRDAQDGWTIASRVRLSF